MPSIEKSNLFRKIYRYIHPALYSLLIVGFLLGFIFRFYGSVFLILHLTALAICVSTNISLKKAVFRIEMDPNGRTITFFMLKGNNVFKYAMSDIVGITINGHMYFDIRNRRKIFWHSPNPRDENEIDFIRQLSNFVSIKFGWLCNIDARMLALKKSLQK